MLPLVWALCAPLAQNPEPFVETRVHLPNAIADAAHDVVSGDVDNDGLLDVLQLGPGAEVLYANQGNGVFEDASWKLPFFDEDSRTGALADFDGDGDLDAFVGNRHAPSRFLANPGDDGPWSYGLDLAGASGDASGCAAGDVDGDGDQDLLLANDQQQDPQQLFRNLGPAFAFWLDPTYPAFFGRYTDVELGDVDADGDLDAVTGVYCGSGETSCSGQLTLLRNDGAGGFSLASGTGLQEFGYRLSFADVHLDGDLDLYASVPVTASADQLYFNDGTGLFSPAALPATVRSTDHAFADLTGDGHPDVLATNDAEVQQFVWTGSGFAAAAPSVSPVDALRAEDFDGDGDADVFGAQEPELTFSSLPALWFNDGTGQFGALHEAPYAWCDYRTVRSIATGDVDGDGRPDLFVGADRLAKVMLQRLGGLWEEGQVLAEGINDQFTAALLLDVDEDGDNDAALGNQGAFTPTVLRVFQNDSLGAFAALPPGPDLVCTGLDSGDVDGDGDLDLAATHAAFLKPEARILTNDGAGAFTLTAQLSHGPPSFYPYASPRLADFDVDGDLDLIFAYEQSSPVLFLGFGAGGFSDVTATHVPPVSAFRLDVGDVDADGAPDVACATTFGGDVLLRNDGTGHLAAEPAFPALDEDTLFIEFGDLERDGDLDLVAASLDGNQVYEGDGAGGFTADVFGDHALWAPTPIDVDGDGDLDLAVGDGYRPTVMINVEGGQVAWQTLPRAGKPLRMDVFGAPGATWALALSPGRAQIPLPPFGVLELDPAGLVAVAAGALTAQGQYVVVVDVPPSAALVGKTFFWQALTGSPLAFTGAELTTITAF